MQVPDDPATAGWYRLGPTPGALGPAVIAGHVTWNQVPAVFFQLAKLRHGDVVKVAREDDRVAVFKVTHVTRYMKSEFPTRAVFGGIDHAGLRLITCGGAFDSSSHRYSDNVVAFATLVSAHPTDRDLP
jgi:sortase (surface protein transpeptidase)